MIRNFILLLAFCTVTGAAQTSPSALGSTQTQPQATASEPPDANAVKARQLLNQMVQALGGQAYLTYQTNEPGVILFYAGSRVAEQKPADEVTISNTKGQSATIFIDSNSHLPIKKTFVHRDVQFGDRDTEAEIWDGYRTVGGINAPFNYT